MDHHSPQPADGRRYASKVVPTLSSESIMRPRDILHNMACDFSQLMSDVLPGWECNEEPGDAYIDKIVSVFGSEPTESSVIHAYKSGVAVPAMVKSLNTAWETSLFTTQIVDHLICQTIISNFGDDAL